MSDGRIGNAVDHFVDRHEREGHGSAIAFRDPWRTLSYAGLERATRRFADAVRAAGVQRERRLAMLLLDTVDFPIAFWGALRAGVVPVPINTLLPHEVIGYILAATGSFDGVLMYVCAHSLAGLASYWLLMGPLKRLELPA